MNDAINLLSDSHYPSTRKTRRSELYAYLEFIRSHSCLVFNCKNPTQAHHVIYKSKGNSCSDILTIPLCQEHHTSNIGIHGLGLEKFQEVYGVEVHREIIKLLEEWVSGTCFSQKLIDSYMELKNQFCDTTKKVKVPQPKKQKSVFKKAKLGAIGLEYCPKCKFKSFPKEGVRHLETCPHFVGETASLTTNEPQKVAE